MSKKTIIITVVIAVFVAAIAFLSIKLYHSQKEVAKQQEDLKGSSELLEYEKKQTEKEVQDLAIEVDGYNTNIHNDSLVKLLDTQKQKIRMLLDELHTVKSTNGKRLAELKAELTTVRKVLINYIHQVDSLNRVNKGLVTENTQVKQKNSELTQTTTQLSKEKQSLTEVVGRAAQLEADNFTVETFNKRDKKTDKLSKIKNIAITFNIAKNVTAKVGQKIIYARITKPNYEVLTKNPGNVFPYENKNIQYSIKKDIEYKGERIKDVLYWEVDETLMPGTYQVDMFAEGRLIGSGSFTLKK